jgi:putative intracellular protease/amidase
MVFVDGHLHLMQAGNMTEIAIVLYPGFTALDFIGPYEVLRNLPGAEVRFNAS